MKVSNKFIVRLFKNNSGIRRIDEIIKEYRVDFLHKIDKIKTSLVAYLSKIGVTKDDIEIFGSTVLELGIKGMYDVDMTLNLSTKMLENLKIEPSAFNLLSVVKLISEILKTETNDNKIHHLIFKPSKRCPMISFVLFNTKCDLTVNNT